MGLSIMGLYRCVGLELSPLTGAERCSGTEPSCNYSGGTDDATPQEWRDGAPLLRAGTGLLQPYPSTLLGVPDAPSCWCRSCDPPSVGYFPSQPANGALLPCGKSCGHAGRILRDVPVTRCFPECPGSPVCCGPASRIWAPTFPGLCGHRGKPENRPEGKKKRRAPRARILPRIFEGSRGGLTLSGPS